jgi:maleylacetate reductase
MREDAGAMLTGRHFFSKQQSVIYGRPAAEVISTEIADGGYQRVFLVTSPSVARAVFVKDVVSAIGERLAGTFSECGPHSPRSDVLKAVRGARAQSADLLIAIGGGSVMDTTKLVQAYLRLGLQSEGGFGVLKSNAFNNPEASPASIAIPTTLSAAEFTSVAGVTDEARAVKEVFDAPSLFIDTVVLDPLATLGVPADIFLSTGMRAIDHCVETLCSGQPTVLGDATAREGLALLPGGLRRVRANAEDVEARLMCQLGAWLSIYGFVGAIPFGASHAIGRVLGGALGIAHGHTSCVLLPAVLEWNAPCDDGRQGEVLAAMKAVEATAAEAVSRLVADLGQPSSLRALGVKREAFASIAEKSLVMLNHRSTSGNPRPVRSADDVIEILERAY